MVLNDDYLEQGDIKCITFTGFTKCSQTVIKM